MIRWGFIIMVLGLGFFGMLFFVVVGDASRVLPGWLVGGLATAVMVLLPHVALIPGAALVLSHHTRWPAAGRFGLGCQCAAAVPPIWFLIAGGPAAHCNTGPMFLLTYVIAGPLALLGFLSSWLGMSRFWKIGATGPPGVCTRCGYNLRGLPERRCPECGTPF